MLNVIMLNDIMLYAIVLNGIMLNVIMLYAIMLNGIMPNVIMLSVMASFSQVPSASLFFYYIPLPSALNGLIIALHRETTRVAMKTILVTIIRAFLI